MRTIPGRKAISSRRMRSPSAGAARTSTWICRCTPTMKCRASICGCGAGDPAEIRAFRYESSKCELQACLHQPGSRGANDLAERCAADIAVNGLRSKELGVVENIEGFQPELHGFRFGKAQVLDKRHIEVLHPGAMEITP